MKTLRFVLFLAFSLGLLPAEEQKFSFALPEFEGRISLGVYDSSGGLVRRLFVDTEEDEFAKGLNGLIAAWDGRNEAGELVPAGSYQVRGYVVGEAVQAEGVAYHFNDWIENDDSARISSVEAVVPEEGESFLLYGMSSGAAAGSDRKAALWRFEEETGLHQELGFSSDSRFMAGESQRVLVWSEVPILYNLKRREQPQPLSKISFEPLWGALTENRVFLGPLDPKSGGVGEWDSGAMSEERELPSPSLFEGVDANSEGLLGWTQEGRIWVNQEGDFIEIPQLEKWEGVSVSAGPGASFWIAGGLGSELVVRQHAFSGELLREMRVTEKLVDQISLFADKVRPGFYLRLASSEGKTQTVRGYRPVESVPLPTEEEPVTADWEVFFDKTLVACRNFGWVDGQLVPDAGAAPQVNKVAFPLPPDTLNARSSELVVDVACAENGLWLREEGGLELLRLAERSDFERIVLVRESSSLRVFAGDGIVVAEYLVTGLNQLAVIDAGTIEIP